jgi:hypothetical protein
MHADAGSLRLTINFDHKIKVWALQLGGWLPLPFTGATVLVLDRNVPSALQALQRCPDRSDLEADRWWMQHLNKPTPALNPVLCAMEGRWRSTPTFDQFRDELERVTQLLESVLTKALIIRQQTEDLKTVYQLLAAGQPRMQREMLFLLEVMPLLASRVPAGTEREREKRVLSAAGRIGVDRLSLACIAALSVLYERSDGQEPRIGRGVLKPKQLYTAQLAFSALADLRALEFLAAGSALGGFTSGLCTRDKYLAAFWVYLGLQKSEWSGAEFKATFTPTTAIFPRLSEQEVLQLMGRLKSDA